MDNCTNTILRLSTIENKNFIPRPKKILYVDTMKMDKF